MDLMIHFIFFSLAFISIQAFHSFSRRTKNLPPGPKPYPVIGNLLELDRKPHKSLANLSKTYGPIMSLELGQVTTIVISSSAMAKEVLQTHDQFLSNRTIPDAVQACRHDHFSLPWMPASPRWRNLRRICNSHLFSGKTLDASEELRREKVKDLLDEVHKSMAHGEAIDIGRAAFMTSVNLLFGALFSLDSTQLGTISSARELKQIEWDIMDEIKKPNLANFFPLLKKIDPQGIRRRTAVHFSKLIELFDRIITDRLSMRRRSRSSVKDRDFLDALIDFSEENGDEINKTQMSHLFLDLYLAGTDTVATTVQWSMAELLRNPEMLFKAREELSQVIGRGNQMKESDITHLPYLQAIVKETFRFHPAGPLLLPRKAETEVEIQGYTIPKGSQILVNVWAIGRDSSIWDNRPDEYMPERFLGSKIDARGRDFELIPFGSGRRMCPGAPMAMRILHLILGSLIHCCDWEIENGLGPDSINMEDQFGFTLQMVQPLRAVPRPCINE